MKLLLLGADGQVGWRLRRSLAPLGELVALARDNAGLCGDLRQPGPLADTIRTIRPDVVVNAAAYTAVDRAEDEPQVAFAVNATACEVLAQETHKLGAWLVHYSTDYVYDGSGERPWTEADATGPLNVYGSSKLAGDIAVAAHNPRHLILRTSWVYDSRGQNFPRSILKAAAARDSLSVVADQWGAPTPADLIADVTAALLSRPGSAQAGTYHLAPAGFTNWHAYACLVVEQGLACGMALRVTPAKVLPIPSSAYPTRAKRPANSRLDTARLRAAYGLTLPPWEDGVRAVVTALAAQDQPNV